MGRNKVHSFTFLIFFMKVENGRARAPDPEEDG